MTERIVKPNVVPVRCECGGGYNRVEWPCTCVVIAGVGHKPGCSSNMRFVSEVSCGKPGKPFRHTTPEEIDGDFPLAT